ncbi:glycosyl hydrolase [Planotetraspora thailandica]|nr:glycosyl hydrolase [Planotetraspora thailandica]
MTGGASAVAAVGEKGVTSRALLLSAFKAPPNAWRPHGWWHWMSPNITTDGVLKDLDWMKRVGLGGFHQFTGNGGAPYVPSPVAYMSQEHKTALKIAIEGAAARGLEAAVTSSAGWSITGAPFVAAEDGMKKHVWTETWVDGGAPVTVPLPQPPTASGTFLDRSTAGVPTYYKDQAVFAYRVDDAVAPASLNPQVFFSGYRATANGQTTTNGDSGVKLSTEDAAKVLNDAITDPTFLSPVNGSSWVRFEFDAPIALRGMAVALNGGDFGGWQVLIEQGNTTVQVQRSDDGATWSDDIALKDQTGSNIVIGAQRSVAIADAAPARHWRAVFVTTANPLQITKLQPRTVPTVHKWEHKAGFGQVGNFYLIDSPDGELRGVAKSSVTDVTSLMDGATGTLRWTPPAGRWVVVRLGYSLTGHQNRPAPPDATGLEVDKLDPERVRRYVNTYLDQFLSFLPKDFVGVHGLSGFLTDSYEAGYQTWTETVLEQFAARRGYDAKPWLPALVGVVVENARETDKFLWDWRKTLAESLADNHYGTIKDVIHERGLKRFYAEAQEDRRGWFGDDTRIRSRADIPMGAGRTATGPSLVFSEQFRLDMKGASSVQHVYGREYAAAETLTFATIRFMPRDIKPFLDQVLAAGATRFVFHSTDLQALDGGPGTSLGVGWYFTRNQTWSEVAAPFVAWTARTSGLLNQGTNIADVAYFYGQEAPVSGLWQPAPDGTGTQPDIPRTCQYDFVNDEIILDELHSKAGTLVTKAGATYRLLYLGGMSDRFTLDVLKKIAQLVRSGVAICGRKPTMSPSLADDDKQFQKIATQLWGDGTQTKRRVGNGYVMTGLSPDEALERVGVAPDWSFEPKSSPLTMVHKSTTKADIYFVVNNDRSNPVTTTLSLRAVGETVELWDAVTGKASLTSFDSRSGRTVLPLTLGAAESIFVIVGKGRPTRVTVPAITEQSHTPTDSGWDVTFSPPRGTPAALSLSALTDLSQSPDTNVRYYSGTLVYKTTLTTDLDPQVLGDARVLIDLGAAHEIAEVRLNGVDLDIAWRAPYRIDVTDALRQGANTLEVRVTNGWANRIIGDLQPGVTETYSTRYNGQTFGVSRTAPLNPSGLVGPVTLVVERGRVEVEAPTVGR